LLLRHGCRRGSTFALLVGTAVSPHRVEDPRQLSRQGDDPYLHATPERDSLSPASQWLRVIALRSQDRPCCFDQKPPGATVARFTDASSVLSLARAPL